MKPFALLSVVAAAFAAHSLAQEPAKPAAAPPAKPAAKRTPAPAAQPGAPPAGQPGAQPAGQPGAQPAGQPGAQPAGQPGAQPAGQPGAPPAAPPAVDNRFPDQKSRLSHALGAFFATRQKNAPSDTPVDPAQLEKGFNDVLATKDASYALGATMAAQLMRDKIEVDPADVLAGFRDGIEGRPPKLDDNEVRAELQGLQESINKRNQEVAQRESAKNEADGKAFLDANRGKDGVKVTDSGLQYMVLEPAKDPKAPKPAIDDTVSANYRGTLIDGTEFDKSPEGQPRPFNLRNVIKGWTEGIQLMPVGSKYRFWVPASLGYGATPRPGGKIKPGDTLIFDVELVRIEPKTASPTATTPPVRLNRGEKAAAATPPVAIEMKDGKPRVTAVTPPVTVEIPPKKKEGEAPDKGSPKKPTPAAPPKDPK